MCVRKFFRSDSYLHLEDGQFTGDIKRDNLKKIESNFVHNDLSSFPNWVCFEATRLQRDARS